MAGFFDDLEDTTSPVEKSFFDDLDEKIVPVPNRTVKSTLKDLAISAGSGALKIPSIVTGLADLPIALATGTRPVEAATNYVGEKTGLQPKEWANKLEEGYSDNQKQSAEDINKVWNDDETNALDVAKAYVTNPGYAANKIVESLPSMALGGVVLKAIMGVGKVATVLAPAVEGAITKQTAQAGAGIIERKLAERAIAKLGPNATPEAIAAAEQAAYRTTAAIAGGASEGIVQAGSAMDNSKGEDQRKNAIAALGSGVVDAVIGFGAGKVAQKFGLETVETAMAKSFNNRVEAEVKNGISKYGKGGKIAGGALSEGILQELPQSAQEQVWQNYADGKPLWEGVNRAAVEGALAGFAMGGGANAMSSQNSKPMADLVIDKRVENILSQDKEGIDKSIANFSNTLNFNNELINDPEKLEQKAKELNVEQNVLIKNILAENKENQTILDKINSGLKAQSDLGKKADANLSPEDKAVKDVKDKLNAKRFEAAQKINDRLNIIEEQESTLLKQYNDEQNLEKKKIIAAQITDQILQLRNEKNTLLEKQQAEVNKKDFMTYSTPEDRQKGLEETFGKSNRTFPSDKDAAESAKVFQEELSSKNISDYVNHINNVKSEDRQQALDQLMNKVNQEKNIEKAIEYADYIKNNAIDQREYPGSFREKIDNFLINSRKEEYVTTMPGPKIDNLTDQKDYILNSAAKSAVAFEKAGMGKGQASSFTDERQVPLTDNQQILVDKNNFEIAKLTEKWNSSVDRDERIDALNKIAALEKDNAAIRTSVEQFNTFEALEEDSVKVASKQETNLGNILNQVKSADGLTGQLGKFLSDFIPESKLNIKVVIDPSIKSAKYVGGAVNTITLRDPSQLNTSIHELTHAVTAREMIANPAIAAQVKLLMERVKLKAVKEAILTPAQIALLETETTSLGYKENISGNLRFENVAYGLLNENEFLAQAMGSSQFQELLKATTIADKGVLRNAWDAFVELVMKALGIKDINKNAFGETLSIIAKLAQQENVNQIDKTVNEELTIEQRLPQSDYDAVYAEKKNIIENIMQTAGIKYHEVKLLADKTFGLISTRLGNVDPELPEHLRTLDFRTSQKIIDVLKIAKTIFDITHGAKNSLGIRSGGMKAKDKSEWDWARLNSDKGKIEHLAQKYNLTEHLITLRNKLDQIRNDAIEVGYDVGFIEEYWPRVIKDQEGFLQATQGISQHADFTEAIQARAKKLGITQTQFEREFPEVKADIISNMILDKHYGIGGPSNIQSRVFETIDKDYAKFYMDADAALMQYVYSLTKKIEARRFFGKIPDKINILKSSRNKKQAEIEKLTQFAEMARESNPEAFADYSERITGLNEDIIRIEEPLNRYKLQNDYTENIGAYIDEMRITGRIGKEDARIGKEDERIVREILTARFNEHGTTGVVNTLKNAAYIDVMGNFASAITQIGDLAWAMYVGKVWTPKGFTNTTKNLIKAIFNKSNITKEDLGFERIAQEFADGTTLGKAVSQVFKIVGIEKMDSIGKEVLINNALYQYKLEAKNPEALAKKLRPIFGSKSLDVVGEILADVPSENVKRLLYSKVLDFHPGALSEMTEFYLIGGDLRVAYMLKTYALKQMDVFRREVFHNIKNGDTQQKIQGIKNMVQLMTLLTLANAGADELKDFMLGKETRFADNVIDNLLTMGGASRYIQMQISKEGFGSAMLQQVLPPMKFINSASKDLHEGYKNYVSGDTSSFDHARIVDSIPLAGKLYYWHYGRGEENKKSLAEKDFSEATKDADLFKKQLENSTDKRTFIESNLDRFKQMKLQENFQAALNRNKAVINKLKKLPSTENVHTRLGQLKNQREMIFKKYIEVVKTI